MLANFAAGVGAGALCEIVEHAAEDMTTTGGWLLMAPAYCLLALWIVLMESTIPRTRTLLACAAMFGVAMFGGYISLSYVRDPSTAMIGIGLKWEAVFAIGFASLVITLIAVTAAAAWRGITRWFLGPAVQQTGELCWRCGYSRAGSDAANCSECGEDRNLGHPLGRFRGRFPLVRVLSRFTPLLLALLLAGGGVYAARRAAERADGARFDAWATSLQGGLMPLPMTPALNSGDPTRVPGAVLTQYELTSFVLMISYDPAARGTEVAMLVRLSIPTGTSMDTALYWELDRSQALDVIRNGLPAGMLQKLAEREKDFEVGVAPGPPQRIDVESSWFAR